ncbi:MAG: adenylyltransferase/cytidyltransferase family protein [Cuniculiplasma sp.]
MIKVMATGVFDIIHLGHIHYLQESRQMGDFLTVVVATDETAAKSGKKLVFSEQTRREIVSNLKMVDEAVIGNHGDIFATVEKLRPNIITLGFDQRFIESQIVEECRRRNIDVEVRRCSIYASRDPVSTRIIKKKILELEGIKA